MFAYRGNLHVHTVESDGTRSVAEVARIAAGCGLDFVGINDHYVAGRPSRYSSGVLLLMGSEFNWWHSHYLAYNVPHPPQQRQVECGEIIGHVRKHKGMGIIAHPFEKGSPVISGGRCFRWRDWQVEGFDGIEIWNLCSQWKDAVTSWSRALGLWLRDRYRPFRAGACREALAKWDELCQKRHVTAVVGSDIHAPSLGWKKLRYRFLDYPMLLSAVNNYIMLDRPLSSEAEAAADQVIAALRRGSCYIGFDWLEPASGFCYYARTEREVFGMGEEAPRGAELVGTLPRPATIRLIKDGSLIREEVGTGLVLKVLEPGVYRLEAWLGGSPWIYANPVYIK